MFLFFDLKKFLSSVELQRSLSSSKYPSDETNHLDQESIEALSKYVEDSWNIADDGEIKKTKKKWFKSDDPKSYPKKALYFSVEKPKSKK